MSHKFHAIDWLTSEQFANYKRFLQVDGVRKGQAFFNCVDESDAQLLRGSAADPFYKDGDRAISDAIEFLLCTNR